MSAKQSNPASTALIMLSIVVVLVVIFQGLMLITTGSVYRIASTDDEDDFGGAMDAFEDATLAMCGICIFWPITLVYIAIAHSITLRGRDVYGKKHALYTLISFFLGVGGVIMAMVGTFLLLIILEGRVGIAISLTLPVAMIAVGLFFFIKDVGGKLFGAIGMGVVCLSQIMLMIALIIALNLDSSLDQIKVGLLLSVIALVLSILGFILLSVGFVQSFIWMGKNKPLIDDEQAQQMQMQQQQLSLQQEQLNIQKQQLQIQMQQAGMIEEKPKDQIPQQTGGNMGQQ